MWSTSRYYGIGINVCYSTLRITLNSKKLDFLRFSDSFYYPAKIYPHKCVRWLCTKNSDKSFQSLFTKIHGKSPQSNRIKHTLADVNHRETYHDMTITGVEHDRYNKRITLKVRGERQKDNELDFNHVEGWELSPFEEENILFDIHEYDAQTLPDWIKADFSLPQRYTELIQSGSHKLYYIDPTVGMGGYVIAGQLIRVKKSTIDS